MGKESIQGELSEEFKRGDRLLLAPQSSPVMDGARVGFIFGFIIGGIVVFFACLLLAGFLHLRPAL